MKILIADDDVKKIRKVVSYLVNSGQVAEQDFVCCNCADQARDILSDSQFDLLILDILLPNHLSDEPNNQSSVDLIVELRETTNLRKPRHIVGLTAYSESELAVSPVFAEATWTVIRSDETSNDWLERIAKCANYISQEQSQLSDACSEVDLCVITALQDPEMAAVHQLPWSWETWTPLDETLFFRKGTLYSDSKPFSVVSAVAPRMGMVASAISTLRMLERFRPRMCVMVGICAGVRRQVEIGDVVFADASWDYQSGKYYVTDQLVKGFALDPNVLCPEATLIAAADQLGLDTSFWYSLWNKFPDRPSNPPKLVRGPMASGAAVLADTEVTRKIVSEQRKVRAIDMEMYGFYCAAQHFLPKPLFFGLKAVCDFADEDKADSRQAYASAVSAAAMARFCEANLARLLRR